MIGRWPNFSGVMAICATVHCMKQQGPRLYSVDRRFLVAESYLVDTKGGKVS
jgi:hypothetical protein